MFVPKQVFSVFQSWKKINNYGGTNVENKHVKFGCLSLADKATYKYRTFRCYY